MSVNFRATVYLVEEYPSQEDDNKKVVFKTTLATLECGSDRELRDSFIGYDINVPVGSVDIHPIAAMIWLNNSDRKLPRLAHMYIDNALSIFLGEKISVNVTWF